MIRANPHTAVTAGAGQLITGAEYEACLTARESDRRARAAFRELVLEIAAANALLFDFGAGTGMDACFYAERGFNVFAYDVDASMCQFFRERCRDLIESGRVTLQSGGYRDFLAGRNAGGDRGIDLVTANFAPLNLIENLNELFARFHAMTTPAGSVLASVLSPYFIGDLRYRWWWRNLPQLVRAGHYFVPGLQAPIFRRRLSDFAAQSAPYFTLARVFRGMPAKPGRLRGRAFGGPLSLATSRYLFLLFAKRPGAIR